MQFIKERVQNITNTLETLQYKSVMQIENYGIIHANYFTPSEVKEEFQPADKSFILNGFDTHYTVAFKAKVPEEFAGETVAFCIHGDDISQNMELQFVLYVNGELKQGLDPNHKEHILSYNAVAGEEYEVFLNCYTGRNNGGAKLALKMVVINEAVRDLFFNISILNSAIEKLESDSAGYIDVLNALNNTINLIDLREYDSPEFYQSIETANNYIKTEYYDKYCAVTDNDVVASCVGHTHIDVAYLWTVEQTREKVIRSFSTVIDLMERYPEYIFMSSQPVLYEFVKDRDPELYEKIKEKIASGQWEVEGGMYLEADCNVTSGESLVRQFLYGQNFFKKEFNKDNKVLWLPDVFGYSAALPQIMKKSNIDYFMTTKISWNQTNQIPYDTFMWKGLDGSEVLTHFISTTSPEQPKGGIRTTYNGMLHPKALMGGWDRFQQKNITKDILICFGYGDGGGGANFEMLETARRMSKGIPNTPTVKMSNSYDYFTKLDETVKGNPKLPKWAGELYLEFHRGTYTTMARNKRDNRKCEIGYTDLEKLSTINKSLGGEYDQAKFEKAWKVILLNQFHDILPGSSIHDVYEVTKEEYAELLGNLKIEEVVSEIASKIYSKDKGIIAYNTTSFTRDTLVKVSREVAEKAFDVEAAAGKEIIFEDAEGYKYEGQITHDGDLLIHDDYLDGMGYKIYYFVEVRDAELLNVTATSFENDYISAKINEKGQIISLVDKEQDREVVKENKVCNELRVFEDRPYMRYNNWDVDIFHREKSWEVSDVKNVEIIENGNLRSAVKFSFDFMSSTVEQIMYFYKNTSRIDFKTNVNWNQSQLLLKALFPVNINNNQANFEIQYGNVKRTTGENTSWDKAQFETVGHKWVDFAETGFGVALLNDSKYGHSVKDDTMTISLIKSGIYPNPVTDREEHEFTYSIFAHEGDYTNGVINEAYDLNYKVYSAFIDKNEDGVKLATSFVNTDEENVVIEVIKGAEDQDGTILRLYESQNKNTKVTVTFANEYKEIILTNLLEQDEAVLATDTNSVTLTVKPFEIVTLKLK